MKKFMTILLAIMVTVSVTGFGIIIAEPNDATSETEISVVQRYGQLKVVNGQLCDQNGNPVQLRGMSSHSLGLYPFPNNTVKNLVNDWHISVVRAAMYTVGYDNDGYIINKKRLKLKVKSIIDQAIDNGIYVIIDWHILSDPDPNTYKKQAKAFFEDMAKTYGDKPNVLYEICNEPNRRKDGSMVLWREIKSYAEFIIPAIRAIDPDSIIIVGTDTWSQGVDIAAEDPLTGDNLMYALHFYAGTHRDDLRSRAETALSKGLAIFVTEWGLTNYTGNGALDLTEGQKWVDWMSSKKISWANWSFCNMNESSAALKRNVGMDGPWTDSQLTDSGKWVKSKILNN